METITNITNAAAKAVWGDTEAKKEPVSGVKGNTAQGEPYDAGNLDTPAQEKVEHTYESNSRDTGLGSTSSNFNSLGNPGTSGSAVPTASNNNSGSVTAGTNTEPMRDNTTSTTSDNVNTNTSSLGSTTAASSLPTTKDTRDTTAGQNDTRDPDKVNSGSSKPLPNPDDVDSSSSAPGKGTSVLGHEPRTVDEIARSNGGDAGRDRSNESISNRPSEGVAQSSGEGAGLGSTSGNEGQESKQEIVEPVHATGLAADGGNFDATKPGAGKEAERLMEEKGIHSPDSGSHGSHGSATKSQSHSSHDDKKDKPSLGERIKAKLHKH